MSSSTTRPIMGVTLMICSVLLFPFSDGIAKYLSDFHTVLFIVWSRFLLSSLFVLPIAFIVDKRLNLSDFKIGWQTLRACFLTAQVFLFYGAISQTPLADVLGAFFIFPIIAMVLSVVILKEKLNRKKVIAVALGFMGTIFILRPGGSIEIGMVYALGAGLLYAFFMIITRIVVQTSPPFTTFTFQSIIGTILLTPFVFVEINGGWSRIPDHPNLLLIILMTFITIVTYILLINALRFAQASTLSPLHYFEWIGTTLVGFFFFGDIPGWSTWIGTSFIVLGGLSLLNLKMTKTLLKNKRLLH